MAKSTEDACLEACERVRGFALKHFVRDRKVELAVQDVAQRAFLSGVRWAVVRKLSAKDKALLRTLYPLAHGHTPT